MILTAIHIFTHEGPLKLYSGMIPMCHRHVIYSGTRLVLYEKARKMLKDESGRMTLFKTVISKTFLLTFIVEYINNIVYNFRSSIFDTFT